MKSTKFILPLLLLLVTFSCDEKNRPLYDEDSYGQFVRFALILDSNGEIIENELDPKQPFVSRYEHKSYSGIKVPVVVTSGSLSQDLKVKYTVEQFGDFSDYLITPADSLSFTADKLTDTIYINFESKWDTATVDSLVLKLTESSLEDISIGYPFGFDTNDELTIILSELVFPYTISSPNSYDLTGAKDEDISFSILFTKGLIADELLNKDLLEVSNVDFAYTLTQEPFETGDTEIKYTFTVNEELDNPYKYYECVFELVEIDEYSSFGNKKITFAKQLENQSDNSINTASHFYDIATDAYNRLYTLFFIDYSDNGECNWRESFAYTYPVEVDADHPNAVLHSDGHYYHAFQIGFNSPNSGRTINSFALKYWFENEYTDSDFSPGFNVPKAIEFFPKDGTSRTEGTLSIIKQDLTISSKEKKSYTISIDGEGTYHYMEGSQELYNDSIFELNYEFEVTSEELYGGTRTYTYRSINRNPEKEEYPDSLLTGCYPPVTL